jgi:hypothetical protein
MMTFVWWRDLTPCMFKVGNTHARERGGRERLGESKK